MFLVGPGVFVVASAGRLAPTSAALIMLITARLVQRVGGVPRIRGSLALIDSSIRTEHESLDGRLAHEVHDITVDDEEDGLGDVSDTDGALYDDEVGEERSGRRPVSTKS